MKATPSHHVITVYTVADHHILNYLKSFSDIKTLRLFWLLHSYSHRFHGAELLRVVVHKWVNKLYVLAFICRFEHYFSFHHAAKNAAPSSWSWVSRYVFWQVKHSSSIFQINVGRISFVYEILATVTHNGSILRQFHQCVSIIPGISSNLMLERHKMQPEFLPVKTNRILRYCIGPLFHPGLPSCIFSQKQLIHGYKTFQCNFAEELESNRWVRS